MNLFWQMAVMPRSKGKKEMKVQHDLGWQCIPRVSREVAWPLALSMWCPPVPKPSPSNRDSCQGRANKALIPAG